VAGKTAAVDSGYVDAQACAGCHRAIWDTYSRTGMGRSFTRAGAEIALEDYTSKNTYSHKPSDRRYTMFRRDGKLYQGRQQIGFDGKETNAVEKEVHFVVGSGNHSRTYLHRRPDGRLVELPVGWYAENGGFWAMNPGYDRPDHEDFRRQITYQCMFCHNGYPKVDPGADASGTAPVFPASLPEGIGCQRCHGPGRAHIEMIQSGKANRDAIAATVVNPARLSTERQLDLCMQCHLETTSFRLPSAILRYRRGMFSYRPGEPLADYALHFDHAPESGHDDKFEIAGAAYRLRQSACFRSSSGKLVCTTCHNPHNAPRGEEAVKHYAAACQGCHGGAVQKLVAAGRHTASADCAGCHMPKRRSVDVVHVAMTDHLIQRRKPARDLLAPLGERAETDETAYKGKVVLYYPAELPDASQRELYVAVAQVRQGANLSEGIPLLEAAIARDRPSDPEFYFELAEAYRKSGQQDKAIALFEQAVSHKADFWPAVKGLGATLARSGRLQQAADTLQKAGAAAPEDASILNDLALAYIGLHRTREAADLLQKAVRLDPDYPDAYNNLGGALSALGDRPGAEAAYREAIRVQPDLAESHKNLAGMLTGAGNFAEAEYHYRKAVESNPTYAAAYYDYGMALAQREQFQLAAGQFAAAVKADPKLAEAHNALGEMWTIQGDATRAIESYRRAVEVKPELAAAQANLGMALLSLRKPAEAKQRLESAVRLNPELFEAHLHLGRMLAIERDSAAAAEHLRKAAQSPDMETRRSALDALQTVGRH
jgi:predicted CXXCH cytochrome family protein